jgi:hypothetical protein
VDTEADGSAGFVGDDINDTDDEDGAVFPAPLIAGVDGSIQLTAGPTGGTVSCWVDFDRDFFWAGAGEQVVTSLALGAAATVSPTFPVPPGAVPGNAPVRCRISSQAGLGVAGEALDGEVEDHLVPIVAADPSLGVAKRLVEPPLQLDATTFRVRFEIRVENLGNVPLSDVQATEDLAATFPGATVTVESLGATGLTVNPAFDGAGDTALLAAGNTLGVGATGTVALDVRVDTGGVDGTFENVVTATGTAPDDTVVSDASTDGADPDPGGDGPGDDSAPTPIALGFFVEIPTLGQLGLLALLLALAGAGAFLARRG